LVAKDTIVLDEGHVKNNVYSMSQITMTKYASMFKNCLLLVTDTQSNTQMLLK